MTDGMFQIDWSSFDWQSFSTLAAGFAAVFGATVVGFRQTRIAERQVEILARQTHIADGQLKFALFEKRYSVYKATQTLLAEILGSGACADRATESAFLMAQRDSQFLFRGSVHEDLKSIWKRVQEFSILTATMTAYLKEQGKYRQGDPERARELLELIRSDAECLVDVFGCELQLGSSRAPQQA